MDIFVFLIIILLGLIAGSFANVCISRLPKDESIIFPGSHCPACNSHIKWYDNIPVFSYLMLKGHCRSCRKTISIQYPLIELINALVFGAIFIKLKNNIPLFVIAVTFCTALLILTVIDLYHRIIPDLLSYGLVLLGILSVAWNPSLKLAQSITGAIFGAGLLWIIGVIGTRIWHKEAMGLGDVKLIAGIGSLTGWKGVIETLVVASFLGAIVGLSLMAARKIAKKSYLPFGPFLSVGAIVSWFFPGKALALLLNLGSW